MVTPRCISCKHPRTGLPEGAPCPECAEPAPDPRWIVVVGHSTETSPVTILAGGAAMIAVGAILIVIFFVTRAAPSIFPGAALMLFGSVVLLRGWLSMQASLDGGDIVWIIRDDGIEVRTPLGKSIWSWDRMTHAFYERGWFAPRLSFGANFSADSFNEVALWLGRGDGDGRAVIQHIRDRMAEAAARTKAAMEAKPAPLSPPPSHRAEPS
jgi:hypothetical protein